MWGEDFIPVVFVFCCDKTVENNVHVGTMAPENGVKSGTPTEARNSAGNGNSPPHDI
jgi:hypothetical protein